MATIVQKDHPTLRGIALPVVDSFFGTPKLKKILTDMKKALDEQLDGVALAAPQIDVSLRIFIVSGRVLDMLYPNKDETAPPQEDMVFINPKIVKISKEREILEEGCLSVRYLYGKISRAKKVKVRAQDENGKTFEMGGSGLLAQIFQHEMDHLDGTLFIDTATELEEISPEELKNRAS